MPAFQEIGNDPVIRLWSAGHADDLNPADRVLQLVLTITHGSAEWFFLGLNPLSNQILLCLQGKFPAHWEQMSTLEQIKWLSVSIKEHIPASLTDGSSAPGPPPVLILNAEACCAIPLSVCRDPLPEESLNLLFGTPENSIEPLLFHIPETEVVVVARYSSELSGAIAALFPTFKLVSTEAAILSRFLALEATSEVRPSGEPEMLLARLDHRVFVAQRLNNTLLGCNTFEASSPEDVLYYALLFDQGQSKTAYLMGFDHSEEKILTTKITETFGTCVGSDWILGHASPMEMEPWKLMTNRSMPALACQIVRNPI